jgi:hypothetical protein
MYAHSLDMCGTQQRMRDEKCGHVACGNCVSRSTHNQQRMREECGDVATVYPAQPTTAAHARREMWRCGNCVPRSTHNNS